MSTIKGLTPTAPLDGSPLRVAIVHARWNAVVINALVAGAVRKLKEHGVQESNIVVQSVPGSFELPYACSKVISGSHVQTGASATDLLGGLTFGGSTTSLNSGVLSPPPPAVNVAPNQPFDAVIAVGVLIKGGTMHFEYICDSVSHALMRLQMDSGVPVIFGVLTVLTDEQALDRAGLGKSNIHNHGEDWGSAAVEMGVNTRKWAKGDFN